MDARGHGLSSKPHDPKEYDLKLRVSDVLAVMDDLGVDKAHYMGYSMGGRIGFGIVKHALDRFHSLIIGGISADTPNSDNPPRDRIDLLRQGMAQYVADAEAKEGPMEAGRRERLLENDPEALIAATAALRGTDGVEALLPNITLPCLLYCGDADGFFPGAKAAAQAIPNAVFVSFPGLHHGEMSRAGERVLPHVTAFLKKATVEVGAGMESRQPARGAATVLDPHSVPDSQEAGDGAGRLLASRVGWRCASIPIVVAACIQTRKGVLHWL